MKGVYIRDGSPNYWIIYYDKYDPVRKRKHINTKIPVTTSDRTRKKRGEKIQGTKQLRDLLERARLGIAERNIELATGAKIFPRKMLSAVLSEFLYYKTEIKPKTIGLYKYAVNLFIETNADKNINQYNDSSYVKFIRSLREKNFAETSIAIITRHLSVVFNYAVSKSYCKSNVIIKTKSPRSEPHPIKLNDLSAIIDFYRQKGIVTQFRAVMLLILTGFRPSTALALKWESIDFENNLIHAYNVKANRQFLFPLYDELKKFLSTFQKDSGQVLNYKTNDSLDFFRKDIRKLLKEKKVTQHYTLYQLRSTFASYMVNNNLQDSSVQKLLDHKDIRITQTHYARTEITFLKSLIDKIDFEKILPGEATVKEW